MYIKKDEDLKDLTLIEQLNKEIKEIASKRLSEEKLSKTSRTILEAILEENRNQAQLT